MHDISLLESIDMIQESVSQSEFDVINSLSSAYCKYAMMLEQGGDSVIDDAVFQEGLFDKITDSSSTKKPGFLKKILGLIRSVIKFIGGLFSKIINAIKDWFKRKCRFVEQIAIYCGLKQVKPDNVESITMTVEEMLESGEIVQKSYDLKLMKKEIFISLNKDGTFHIKPNELLYEVSNDESRKEINIENPIKNRMDLLALAVNLLSEQGSRKFEDFMKHLNGLLDNIENRSSDAKYDASKIISNIASSWGIYGIKGSMEGDYSYKTFVEFQKRVSEMSKRLDTVYREFDSSFDVDPSIGNALNAAYTMLNQYQMGLTALTSQFNISYDIDYSFIGCTDNIEQIAQFCSECIKDGMPSKNIIRNIYLIATPEFRGSKVQIHAGQSRLVCFPDNDAEHVYKFATNGFGISSNKVEHHISKLAEKQYPEMKDFIAMIVHAYGNDTSCIVQERAESSTLAERKHAINKFLRKLEDWYKANPKFPVEIADIHYDNIGKSARTGDWVMLDYGYLNMTYRSKK